MNSVKVTQISAYIHISMKHMLSLACICTAGMVNGQFPLDGKLGLKPRSSATLG